MSSGKKDSLEAVGARLREARKIRGLRLWQVAERVGCTPQNLSSIERAGGWGPSGPLLRGLARTLGVSEKWLKEGVGPMYEAGSLQEFFAKENMEPYQAEKRLRLVREVERLAREADDDVIDALLSNVEQFDRIPKRKKEEEEEK